ncbi:adhesion G protein-coupled receptor B2 [Trichonephila clavipes]|nr:adhesion G protein-coupled receptor B2 [Trichonephila clavipes]
MSVLSRKLILAVLLNAKRNALHFERAHQCPLWTIDDWKHIAFFRSHVSIYIRQEDVINLIPIIFEIVILATTCLNDFAIVVIKAGMYLIRRRAASPEAFCKVLGNLVALHFKYDFWHMTATAVVQSGRPIFDDFFQHLWPYVGNNTANVVFQIVKRLGLMRIDQ